MLHSPPHSRCTMVLHSMSRTCLECVASFCATQVWSGDYIESEVCDYIILNTWVWSVWLHYIQHSSLKCVTTLYSTLESGVVTTLFSTLESGVCDYIILNTWVWSVWQYCTPHLSLKCVIIFPTTHSSWQFETTLHATLFSLECENTFHATHSSLELEKYIPHHSQVGVFDHTPGHTIHWSQFGG